MSDEVPTLSKGIYLFIEFTALGCVLTGIDDIEKQKYTSALFFIFSGAICFFLGIAGLKGYLKKKTYKSLNKTSIEVINATYGAKSQWVDVTDVVRNQINNTGGTVTANTGILGTGDPLYGMFKTLIVRFKENGELREVSIPEDNSLNLSSDISNPPNTVKMGLSRTVKTIVTVFIILLWATIGWMVYKSESQEKNQNEQELYFESLKPLDDGHITNGRFSLSAKIRNIGDEEVEDCETYLWTIGIGKLTGNTRKISTHERSAAGIIPPGKELNVTLALVTSVASSPRFESDSGVILVIALRYRNPKTHKYNTMQPSFFKCNFNEQEKAIVVTGFLTVEERNTVFPLISDDYAKVRQKND